MGSIVPAAILGLIAPIVIFIGAMWMVRRWKASVITRDETYTGAMASPAFEAMMNEARQQRDLLRPKDEGAGPSDVADPPSG